MWMVDHYHHCPGGPFPWSSWLWGSLKSFLYRYHFYTVQISGMYGVQMPFLHLRWHVHKHLFPFSYFTFLHGRFFLDILSRSTSQGLEISIFLLLPSAYIMSSAVLAYLMGTSFSDSVLRHAAAFFKSSQPPTQETHWYKRLSMWTN